MLYVKQKLNKIKVSILDWLKDNLSAIKRYSTLGGLVLILWILVFYFANSKSCTFSFITKDIDSLRTLISSIFQGLSAFFAIIVSVSLLVTQLAYGAFSPRLMPNFLRNKTLVTVTLLFVGALSLNLFLLAYLTPQTVSVLLPVIFIDLVVSLIAIIAVIPASFELFNLAHPIRIGWSLIERFDARYFEAVSFKSKDLIDDSLPLLQSVTVKSIKEADTDFALRIIVSFDDTLSKHMNEANAKSFADYFSSYIRKVSISASEQNEERLLIELMFMNEELESKAMESSGYLSNSWASYNGSTFVGNIIYIIELAIKNRQPKVVGMCFGALHRLRKKAVSLLPPDNEISTFILGDHFRNKKEGEPNITGEHRRNEHIFEYIQRTYFDINATLASIALEHSPRSMGSFIREMYSDHYPFADLEEVEYDKHKKAIKRIAYSGLYNLTRITRTALKEGVNLADEVASGLHSPNHHLLKVDPKLVEGHIDVLGHLLIESIQYDMYDADPESTIYSTGVVLRSFSRPNAPDKITIKLLNHLEKALEILTRKQGEYPSPLFDKIKKNLCEEIATAKNWHKSSDAIKNKVDAILAKYPDDIES